MLVAVLSAACFLLAAFACFTLIRNELVFRERGRVLELIGAAARDDIDAGRDWEWRYEALDEIPYDRMIWSPHSVKSWFKNHPATRMGARP